MQASLFAAVSRMTFWISTLSITAGLALLSWWGGLYRPPKAIDEAAMRMTDPTQVNPVEYTLLGQIIVLLCAQFLVANLIFWPVVWMLRRVGGWQA